MAIEGPLRLNTSVPLASINFANDPVKGTSASNVIEFIASRSSTSSTVYVYDLAEQIGFGTLTKSWPNSMRDNASVVNLQARVGGGLNLVGRLSEGTSQDTVNGAILTAYTTPTGISAISQSLSYLPHATDSCRLILQVPTVTPVGDSCSLSPTLAPLVPTLALLPENICVILSATPQESIDLAALSYSITDLHVIHLFDHHSATREMGHAFKLTTSLTGLISKDAFKQAGYSFFDYVGDINARTVFVLLNGPFALTAKALVNCGRNFGVIIVRLLRPWDEDAFREMVPPEANEVHVFEDVPNETTQGVLYSDVFSSLYDPFLLVPTIHAHRITPKKTQEYLSQPSVFVNVLLGLAKYAPAELDLYSSLSKKLLFFNSPNSPVSSAPLLVTETLSKIIPTRLLTDHDIISRPGGTTVDRILLTRCEGSHEYVSIPSVLPLDGQNKADFIGVLDPGLLKSHDVLRHAKPDSAILIITAQSSAELFSTLPSNTVSNIIGRDLRIYTLDSSVAASNLAGDINHIQSLLVYLAFLRLYLGKAASEILVRRLAESLSPNFFANIDLAKASARAWAGLAEIELPADQPSSGDDPSQMSSLSLRRIECNAILVETNTGETSVKGARLGSWHDAAKHIIFPSVFSWLSSTPVEEEYPQNPALRPEVSDRTYLVTCTVNRRLTPLDYDRNVFHIEFDTSGTGLKYAIGEALGIHGWNDSREVLDFCTWYGVDPGRLVTIPIVAGEERMHTRTIFQALQQQIDLFGRPPKSFYVDLAPYATHSPDIYALQFIGSPEGSSTFKRLSEKETVTFADVLRRYSSAKPGIEKLCEMIGDIKPRHYSIASAQSVVGDRVDLLVVTVDWVTPSGSPRYGQCTRYLAGLKIGQKVTVSVKPSVMKLPPDDQQPIILAGLGTGAAPFRAFLQHRACLAQKGITVGPTYYYFGSRHQAQEYLYGEEIEAFILDGTITKARLAFSRDGPKKVYIQHLMLEDAQTLANMLMNEKGVFYLCGPTWPVPDVYEALVGALVKYQGYDVAKAGAFLEGLKEEERYVLEVAST